MSLFFAMLFNSVLVMVCGFALIRGGRPERIGALINLVASGGTTILRLMDVGFYAPADVVVLSIDIAVTVGFFRLATTTTRFWPIWALGFAFASLLVSVAGALLPQLHLFAYHTGLGIYAYLALGALTLGTYRLPRDADTDLRNGSRLKWQEKLQKLN